MSERVPASLAGERIDRVVALATDRSRSTVAGLVEEGRVRLDGEVVVDRAHRVLAGQLLEVELPPPDERRITPEPRVEVPVVHEDRDLLVVDKPAGLVVHPGAGHETGTLVHGLLARYPDLATVGEPDRPGIVHRLDRDTSGLLVVARTPEAYDALVAQLAARTAGRTYRTLVCGRARTSTGIDRCADRPRRAPPDQDGGRRRGS
ncbi:MAG: pseudouridine synthase [Acidimicrobiia bacterium]|nr:pseudouridine synthase [Acidimicrobiia bacterium]